MSYARFGCDGSDVYVFGSSYKDEHYIECCGCILTRDDRRLQPGDLGRLGAERYAAVEECDKMTGGPFEWNFGPVQHYPTRAGIIAHLRDHIAAGHTVPGTVIPEIEADSWIP